MLEDTVKARAFTDDPQLTISSQPEVTARARGFTDYPQLIVLSQPGVSQGPPEESSKFKPTPNTCKNQKKSSPGAQQAIQKKSKSLSEDTKFARQLKK